MEIDEIAGGISLMKQLSFSLKKSK